MGLLQPVGLDKADGLRQGHTAARWGRRMGSETRGSLWVLLACSWDGLCPGGEVALGLEGFPTALTYALSLWQSLALR